MQYAGVVLFGIMLKIPSISSFASKKILNVRKAKTLIASLKRQGKTVGLCQGGFDLLHPGHIKHFESARKQCDVLVVSVTADGLVSERKGEGRPIFSDKLRAYMIAGLSVVDYVVIANSKGIDIVNRLMPNFYIKGPDFIGKQTPGIAAERQAIAAIGGNMLYTDDPKLSTTEIIDYIKNKLWQYALLLVLDRDGTLVTNDDFFGRQKNWQKLLKVNEPVINFISTLQTKYKTTIVVASNQSGVARKYFTDQRVKQINTSIDEELKKRGIKVCHWQYCPDVDRSYASKYKQGTFDSRYIKTITKRKPSPAMVKDALAELKMSVKDFDQVLVLGDRVEDEHLAKKLNARFLNVRGKSYDDLLKAWERKNSLSHQ